MNINYTYETDPEGNIIVTGILTVGDQYIISNEERNPMSQADIAKAHIKRGIIKSILEKVTSALESKTREELEDLLKAKELTRADRLQRTWQYRKFLKKLLKLS